VALTRFKRTLPRARQSVRELTHTLHLPPAQSEIYDGPHPEWLRDVLEQLPNLQSLIVRQLPFFDHSALLALRKSSVERPSSNDFPTFPLKLLIAAQCENTTSAGLAEAFLHWPNLLYLDLSGTIAARDHAVFSSLRLMTGLQVLILRHIQLTDEDVEILADSIGIRVRSLDIRDNKITDLSIRTILSKCFHTTHDIHAAQDSIALGMVDEDWPSGVTRPQRHLLQEFRGEDLEKRFFRRLTDSVVHRLPSEDLPSTGITHLYIANNFVTVEGVTSLLKTQNLVVLDAGAVDTAKALGRPRTRSSISQLWGYPVLPGSEKLTPVLEKYAFRNLTYLRLHHAVVTRASVFKSEGVEKRTEESVELDAKDNTRFELEPSSPAYELAVGPATPRYELAGDMMQLLVTPAIGQAPEPSFEESDRFHVRRGSVFAPEVVAGQDNIPAPYTAAEEEDPLVVLTATGLGPMAQAINGIGTSNTDEKGTTSMEEPSKDMASLSKLQTNLDVALIEEQRKALRSHDPQIPRSLSPGALPALKSLVLTDVPCIDKDEHIITALKNFISGCAKEHHLAFRQARLELPSLYVPGFPRSRHLQHRLEELFALRCLILEMAAPTAMTSSFSDRPRTPQTPTSASSGSKQPKNRSSTEDPDTTAFWNAAENDFSFFDDEECGLPASEPSMHFPRSILSEKMVLPPESLHAGGLPTLQRAMTMDKGKGVGFDVVQELARFRKERKELYERAGKTFVEGYWPGEVKIVRNTGMGTGSRAKVDWYGNMYDERGGVYR
jgi:hypothetical protein